MHEPRPRPGKRPGETHEDRSLARVLSAEEAEIFLCLFSSDACVVDFDFSAWQQSIALYLTADHASEMRHYYPAVFVVNFLRVRQWNIAFNHLEDKEATETALSEHFYWTIRHYAVQPIKQGVELTLWGDEEEPRIVVTCEQITIRELPRYLLAQVAPGWSEIGRPFLRPSIERLAQELES